MPIYAVHALYIELRLLLYILAAFIRYKQVFHIPNLRFSCNKVSLKLFQPFPLIFYWVNSEWCRENFGLFVIQTNLLINLQLAKSQVKNEASDLKTEDVTICSLTKGIAHLRGRWQVWGVVG
jgi:hypothetical protein